MFPTLSQWFHILHQKFSDQCLSGLVYRIFSWFFNHSHLYNVLLHVCRHLSPGWLLSSHPFTSPNIAVYSPSLTNNSKNETPPRCGNTIQKWKPNILCTAQIGVDTKFASFHNLWWIILYITFHCYENIVSFWWAMLCVFRMETQKELMDICIGSTQEISSSPLPSVRMRQKKTSRIVLYRI